MLENQFRVYEIIICPLELLPHRFFLQFVKPFDADGFLEQPQFDLVSIPDTCLHDHLLFVFGNLN